jgi:hypothetical protein
MGGVPHVAIGRVVVPPGEDPRLVQAQMEVLEGGYFVSAVRDLEGILSFRLPGCLPVDLPLKGRAGEMVFLGEVVLPAATPDQLGGIRGQVRLADGQDPSLARVSASIERGPINRPSNGSEPRRYSPDPLFGLVGTNGEYLLTGLSPASHWVSISASGYLPVARSIAVSPGETNELKQVVLERPAKLQLSWCVSAKPEFASATRRTAILSAGNAWKAKPGSYGFDLRFHQRNGRLFFEFFYSPCRLADLGLGPLDPAMSVDPGFLDFREPQGEALAGHVYLLHQESFDPPYWVLFRIDWVKAEGAKGTGFSSTAPSPARADTLPSNVAAGVQRIRDRLTDQTRQLDHLYELLGTHLEELEDEAERLEKEQSEKAAANK